MPIMRKHKSGAIIFDKTPEEKAFDESQKKIDNLTAELEKKNKLLDEKLKLINEKLGIQDDTDLASKKSKKK